MSNVELRMSTSRGAWIIHLIAQQSKSSSFPESHGRLWKTGRQFPSFKNESASSSHGVEPAVSGAATVVRAAGKSSVNLQP